MIWMEIAGGSKSSECSKIPDKLDNVSVEKIIVFTKCGGPLSQNHFKLMR